MTQTMDPLAVLGIEFVEDEHVGPTFNQVLGAALVDHRGVLGMSSYATMAEIVGGRAFNRAYAEGSSTVQSRLSLSAPAPARLGSRVRGTGRLLGSTDGNGVTTAELIDDEGSVICTATGRGVLVGRPSVMTPSLETSRPDARAQRPEVSLPASLDPDLTGPQILAGLADGSIAVGPMQRLLGLRVAAIGDREVEVAVSPSPGMANQMGTMHGGIVTSIMAEVCSLGAELSARAGGRYQVCDISVSFLRSPALDQGDLTVTVQTVKSGRRICSVIASMTDSSGTLLVQAVADATAA